jgi:hypothetical protein
LLVAVKRAGGVLIKVRTDGAGGRMGWWWCGSRYGWSWLWCMPACRTHSRPALGCSTLLYLCLCLCLQVAPHTSTPMVRIRGVKALHILAAARTYPLHSADPRTTPHPRTPRKYQPHRITHKRKKNTERSQARVFSAGAAAHSAQTMRALALSVQPGAPKRARATEGKGG